MEDHVNEEHSEEKKVCTCGDECNCGDNCECGERCDCEKCGVVEKGEAETSEPEDVAEPESETETVAPATYAAPEATRRPLEKVMIVCSKAGVDSVYAALIMANGARSEGIEVDMFFTFFGLDTITKKRMEHLKVAIAGNPGMHMPEMVGVLPGMEAFATNMMRKEMEKLDIPGVGEFLEIIKAAGGMIFGCKLAAEIFHLTRDDMWEGVDDILTVGQFYERATERSQIIFI
jgi:peroxiredoxin family protein